VFFLIDLPPELERKECVLEQFEWPPPAFLQADAEPAIGLSLVLDGGRNLFEEGCGGQIPGENVVPPHRAQNPAPAATLRSRERWLKHLNVSRRFDSE
jgi:hypothetical protein